MKYFCYVVLGTGKTLLMFYSAAEHILGQFCLDCVAFAESSPDPSTISSKDHSVL